jgi:anti-sigma factor RsiW
MTCRELHEFLMAYLDGELPADQRAAFERHISLCTSCLAYLETYKKTPGVAREAMLRSTKQTTAPEGLVRAILAARTKHT